MERTGMDAPDARVAGETAGSAAADTTGPTIASYFQAFGPVPAWGDLCSWPPDVFTLANLVLDHTEAYRLAVSPPRGRHWPPAPDWNEQVSAAARQWQIAAGTRRGPVPRAVRAQWDVVTRYRDTPMAALQDAWELWGALLTLHAMADEACAGLAAEVIPSAESAFERRAWAMLIERGSLSRVSSARVQITPKTQFAARGITMRSFSRYLALAYEGIDLRWRRIEPAIGAHDGPLAHRNYNVVLVPWPLHITERAFHPVAGPLDNMDPEAFGFFEFAPEERLDGAHLTRLLEAARAVTTRIDGVILPESAVEADEIPALEDIVAAFGVTILLAGVRERATGDGLGRNYVHIGVRTGDGWERHQQAKHHRWCLDEAQIRNYHLARVLDPGKQWWEAIELPRRKLQIIDTGGGATTAPLVCEDLARMDEVTDLLRRIGPSVVIALLLDGPQLASRWPCRYASVLAEEPGSAVLTLTSFGMVARSRPPGTTRSRAVALWHDPTSGRHELELDRGAGGILITASAGAKTVWTADGRSHHATTPDVVLSRVQQLRARSARSPSRRLLSRRGRQRAAQPPRPPGVE